MGTLDFLLGGGTGRIDARWHAQQSVGVIDCRRDFLRYSSPASCAYGVGSNFTVAMGILGAEIAFASQEEIGSLAGYLNICGPGAPGPQDVGCTVIV